MIQLTLTRDRRTKGKAVTGRLSVPFNEIALDEDEEPIIVPTLENADYLIPEGIYPLDITWSYKFKKYLPQIMDVPDRAGIRIHRGTIPEHSTGCVLVDAYGLSCVTAIINRVKKYMQNEELFIEIKSCPCG